MVSRMSGNRAIPLGSTKRRKRDLKAALDQLVRYAAALENPPLQNRLRHRPRMTAKPDFKMMNLNLV